MFIPFKGSLSPSKNESKRDKDFYCTLHKYVLIRFIQRNQGHRDSVMHEFHCNVNKVNKAVAKVRTIGDRLPLKGQGHVTVNKPFISTIYIVAVVFCSDFGGWGESTRKLLPKSHQHLGNRTTYECFVCFSTNLKSSSSK